MRFDRILVTGASGLLGRYVVDALSSECTVTGFDRRRGDHDIAWRIGDVTDRPAVAEAMAGQDGVVHLAAMANIWAGDGETVMRVNSIGTWQVLDAAQAAGVKRVIVCSSDSVVGFTVAQGAMLAPLYLPIDQAHPLRPTDPYALSKLLGEEIAYSFTNRGALEVLVLRPVFVAYPEMHGEIAARAADPANYRGAQAGGPSVAGGGPVWHHIDPRDAGRAFKCALEMPYRGFEAFFLSAATTLAPEPTLTRLHSRLGRLPPIRDPALYEREPFAPLYDLGPTRERLGFVPEFDARKMFAPALTA